MSTPLSSGLCLYAVSWKPAFIFYIRGTGHIAHEISLHTPLGEDVSIGCGDKLSLFNWAAKRGVLSCYHGSSTRTRLRGCWGWILALLYKEDLELCFSVYTVRAFSHLLEKEPKSNLSLCLSFSFSLFVFFFSFSLPRNTSIINTHLWHPPETEPRSRPRSQAF